MRNIKTILFYLIFFSAGYGLNVVTDKQITYAEHSIESSHETSDLLLSECENKNLELTNQINKIVRLSNTTSSNVAAPIISEKEQEIVYQAKIESEQYPESQLAFLNEYYAKNELKKQQDFLNSINASPENMPQALSENYEKDTIDHVWAPEKKALLDDYISKNDLLRSLPNVESDCRSKQCKISTLSDDPTALTHLAENLRSLTANDFITYTYTIDEKNHTTNIYLDRKPTN